MVFIDAEPAGKTGDSVALGAKYSLSKLGIKVVHGVTVDSGCGTPESSLQVMTAIFLTYADSFADSCGLHDAMSVFRLPCKHFIGEGGVGNRNAVQLCHSVYDLFNVFKEKWSIDTWKGTLESIWNDVRGADADRKLLDDLLVSIKEPLITRWWTIGSAAGFVRRYWFMIYRIARATVNDSWASDKESKIAQAVEPIIFALDFMKMTNVKSISMVPIATQNVH
mmetsp:Transcript_24365/g.45408  ORF Transcript_24365/g.45408 Transcript_24365/m.45408 type:complete len:223 (+) Transcript_24365:1276-1944(+)